MVEAIQAANGAEAVIWDLSDLYTASDDPALARDMEQALSESNQFAAKYRGRVGNLSAGELAEALATLEAIEDRVGRVQSFAQLQWSTNTGEASFGALLQRVREFGAQIAKVLVFFDLEWSALDETAAKVAIDPLVARWKHHLDTLRQLRPHLLTEPEEKILAETSVTGVNAWRRFFGEVVNSIEYDLDGQKVSESTVLRQLYSPDRAARLKAADSLTAGLRPNLRVLTYVMNTVLADKNTQDRLRSYPTWVSSRNLDNEISDEAVEALVQAVTARYDIVARYYRLKQKVLNYKILYDYDRYAPLTEDRTRYQWTEARDIVLTAFGRFDESMADIAQEFFEKRWIHAPVRAGKRGGAFASPTVPSNHPYVFVNFTGSSRDVVTLAHELGHGIHMYLSRPRGIFGAGTPLTTAEMASVFGEMLVFQDLMARQSDPQAQMALLGSKIEDAFATVFRQISMNRFEHRIHTTRRESGELNTDQVNAAWMETQLAMFGDSVVLRDDYAIWWSYVSHFINVPGYVYAYAFGQLLVMALFNRYRAEGKNFVPRYLDVLGSGGSDAPEKILAKAGVDLTDPGFWQEGLKAIETMVDDFEGLVKRLPKT